MDTEIADLESFIDSYVAEDDCIASTTFTNSSAANNEYEYNDKEFEEELKERQSRQDSMIRAMSSQRHANGAADPIGLSSDFYTAEYLQEAPHSFYTSIAEAGLPYAPYPNDYHFNPMVDSHPPSQPYLDDVGMPNFHIPDSGASSLNAEQHRNISNNDLRHRLNGKKRINSQRKDLPGQTAGHANNNRRINKGQSTDKRADSKSVTTNPLIQNSDNYSSDRANSGKSKPTAIKPHSRHSSQSSSSESSSSAKNSIVSDRSKSEVHSWLHRDAKAGKQPLERQFQNMEVSKKSDLSTLLKSAQSFMISEEKMKEVAEMICKKALKNPASAQSGAVLCSELSHRMVNGTSFRTVLLNVVQSHFKNRQRMILKAIESNDNEWCGFVTFLTELYLNLRTSSNERLKALVNPVFDCFHLTLDQKQLNRKLSECLFDNLKIAGAFLDEASPQRMTQLISLLRDTCVVSSNMSLEARRNLLQSLEYYARGWKSNASDEPYYRSDT